MSDEYKIYEPTYSEQQKEIKQHRFYIDDIIHTLIQMRQEGYRYASFDVVEECQDDDGTPYYACMFPTADDCGGYVGCDYDPIPEVPFEELDEYAEVGKPQPPYRQAIEFVKREPKE
uniref:Uncharacterized protein n=1 Tax=uncultured prokaryote TaxID=198431 RepID=A0A0H5QP94_9ZZZZ|nr:hypothetical protein [uncultured prokaryote]